MTAPHPLEGKVSAETLALVKRVAENTPSQKTDEFTRLQEGLLNLQVCTSLSDEEATARANLVPSGTTFGWALITGDDRCAPVPCADRPETHRHLMFEC